MSLFHTRQLVQVGPHSVFSSYLGQDNNYFDQNILSLSSVLPCKYENNTSKHLAIFPTHHFFFLVQFKVQAFSDIYIYIYIYIYITE
jgi:hypothetical protein